MKQIILFFLCSFCALYLAAQETARMTLQECIQYAESHNATLQNANFNINVSEIQLRQARLQRAPTITASASQNFGYAHGNSSFNIGGNYAISAGINIFNGLNTYYGIKQSQLQLTQSQLQMEQSKNAVRIDIIRAYLTILMNQEMLDYQINVLNSSRQQVEDGAQKYKVGQILESDYLLLQAQYMADSTNYQNTKISIENEYVTLRNLLNMNREQAMVVVVPDSVRLSQSMIMPSLNDVIVKAFNYLPELQIQKNAVDIASYDVKLAKSAYYPSLTANAGISTGYSAAYNSTNHGLVSGLHDGLNESVGLNLSIPIYQQGKIRNNVKIKNIQVQQAENDLKNTENQVIKEIEGYHLDLQKAYNNFQLSNLQKQAYYANYMAYNQKFKYGSITAVDLLQQQTNYLNILSNFMQNKYSYIMQVKVLEVYTGQTVTL